MEDLTAFQRDILYVVCNRGEPHGLKIKSDLQEYYGEEVNHGRLYPNLDQLVGKGLMDKSEKDKRTNGYSLTDRGRRALSSRQAWEQKHIDRGVSQ